MRFRTQKRDKVYAPVFVAVGKLEAAASSRAFISVGLLHLETEL